VSCICSQLALDNYRDYVHANAVHPLVQLALGDVRKALVDAKLTMNKYVQSSYTDSSCALYVLDARSCIVVYECSLLARSHFWTFVIMIRALSTTFRRTAKFKDAVRSAVNEVQNTTNRLVRAHLISI